MGVACPLYTLLPSTRGQIAALAVANFLECKRLAGAEFPNQKGFGLGKLAANASVDEEIFWKLEL